MINLAYAMGQAPSADPQTVSPFSSFLPLILIFAVFYFLLIRPQRVQQQKLGAMINDLKKDDRILTTGGIYGRIISLKGKQLEVEIATNTRIIINRTAVAQLVQDEAVVVEDKKS